MALVLGAADMIGCGKDSELVDPLPLLAFALFKLLWKLLNFPLHLLLELPEPKLLLPNFLEILLETEAIVVYWSYRFRAQRRLSRWERTDIAAAGRGSRHENGEDLFGGGQQMPDPDEQGDRAENQEGECECQTVLKPVSESLLTLPTVVEESSDLAVQPGLGITNGGDLSVGSGISCSGFIDSAERTGQFAGKVTAVP